MRRAVDIPAFAAALALVGLSACMPDVPASPTYTKDVQPILAAHCVRCHGANDTLNGDPAIHTPMPTPLLCYLQRYEDGGDCSVASTCKRGAGYCGPMIPTYINYPKDAPLAMPPPPSDRLNDWEKEVLTRWANEKPPAQ